MEIFQVEVLTSLKYTLVISNHLVPFKKVEFLDEAQHFRF